MTTVRTEIHQKDASDFLYSEFPDGSIDLLITDPPYESLEKHRKIGTTTRLKNSQSSSNEWFEIFPNDRFNELFELIYKKLKTNSHFYMFCDQETMFIAKPIAENVGFKFWKPLIWDKVAIGMGYHYRARYEMILFFEKGKRKLNNLATPDILSCKRVHKGYPTEKPKELMKILINQSSSIGDLVVDPFCGSGSVGAAALDTKRSFVGNDISEAAVLHASNRLGVSNLNQIRSKNQGDDAIPVQGNLSLL